jgi:hypothetical protein
MKELLILSVSALVLSTAASFAQGTSTSTISQRDAEVDPDAREEVRG